MMIVTAWWSLTLVAGNPVMSDDNSGHTVGHYPSERVITPVFTYADGRMGPAPDQIIVPGSSIFVTAATFCCYLALVLKKIPSEVRNHGEGPY